jgi:hypothetical protein
MTTSKRAVLAAVLLLTFTLGASLQAHATLETFTFTMNWSDGHTVFPTTGFFEFNTSTMFLGNYSISAPDPFGTLNNGNSTAQLFVNGGPCLSINPCFGLTVKEPVGNNLYDKLELAFAGSLFTGGGTVTPLFQGAIGRAVCDDPCYFTLTASSIPPPNVPEPSSMLLLAAGVLGMGFTLRRKITR